MSDTKYRPEIDGLRAFAVLPVIFFHMGADWMPGGYAGVDVFFVISGFLITRLILADLERDTFKLSEFWLRRVKRILPALMTMIVVTSIVGCAVFYSIDINELGDQGIAALLSMANFFFWIQMGSYWGPGVEDSALLHTWTLSVEEQFYLFFPLLLLILVKYFRDKLIAAVGLLVVLSLAFFLGGAERDPTATFYLLPTRAWELGSGCLLAVIAANWTSKFSASRSELLSTVGLAAIVAPYFLMSNDVGMAGGLVFPVLGAVLVIAFSGDGHGITRQILTAAPVIYVGKISYSLYLWHWPVIVFTKVLPLGSPLQTAAISLLVTAGLSVASYHFVEQTTRRRKNVVRYILCCFAATISLSALMSTYKGDVSAFSETTWKGKLYNVAPKQDFSWQIERMWRGITAPEPKIANTDAYATGGLVKQYGGDVPRVVVLGDSHALMWAGVLDEVFSELGVTASFYAADGTPTFFEIPITKTRPTMFFSLEQRYMFDKMRLEFLSEWKPDVVVIASRWRNLKGIQQTDDLIGFLGKLGSKVLLVESPPEIFQRAKNAPRYLSFLDVQPRPGKKSYLPNPNLPEYVRGRRLLQQIADQHRHCEIIPVADVYQQQQGAWVIDGFDVLYIDANHLSHQGALRAKGRIKAAIQNSL